MNDRFLTVSVLVSTLAVAGCSAISLEQLNDLQAVASAALEASPGVEALSFEPDQTTLAAFEEMQATFASIGTLERDRATLTAVARRLREADQLITDAIVDDFGSLDLDTAAASQVYLEGYQRVTALFQCMKDCRDEIHWQYDSVSQVWIGQIKGLICDHGCSWEY